MKIIGKKIHAFPILKSHDKIVRYHTYAFISLERAGGTSHFVFTRHHTP